MITILEQDRERKNIHFYKAIIIADDFTGSNDTGVQLKNYGLSTVTIINKDFINKVNNFDAVVIDSETRTKTTEEAYKEVAEIAESIKKYSTHGIIYKKIDSTMRGNIGVEVKALIDILEPEIVVFAPAYPKNNRTTIHGIQYINNKPIDKTEMSHDPKNPVFTADIKQLLKEGVNKDFYHINLEQIRNEHIANIVREQDLKYLYFDAENDEDLILIVKQIMTLDKRILWVGSAGLAEAIVKSLADSTKKNKRVFAVVGSVNSISALQARKAVADGQAKVVTINVKKAILNPQEEKDRLVLNIVQNFDNGFDVVLASAIDSQQIITASSLGKTLNMSLDKISSKISNLIGDIVFEIVGTKKISGMFLTGGDTAINVIKKLCTNGAIIIEEIEPGIPLIELLDGPYKGFKIVTKAGAFGNEDSILNAMKYLRKINNFK